MRRALTILTLPILLLSAWDCVPLGRVNLNRWSRLRQQHRPAPDEGRDRLYAQLAFHLPLRGRVGLVQAEAPGSTAHQVQHYFLQYSLAPRLVIPGADEEFVIVYGPPAAQPSLVDPAKFARVRPFAEEFALYRRTRP